MQIVPKSPRSYDPALLVGQTLSATRSYAVVSLSYQCNFPNVFFEHLSAACIERDYVLLKTDQTKCRIQVLMFTQKQKNENDTETEQIFSGLARTFADGLSRAMEDVQDDAIVWWHRVSPISNEKTNQ